jgi:hypothetical protein
MTPSGYNYPDPVNALKDIDDWQYSF